MSDQVALESTRRRLTPKQADTIARLTAAAMTVLRREGFSGLTIRGVAAEAGIGAATAYTYFSSKEHLVTEVFWRRLASAPMAPVDSGDPAARAVAVLRHIALLFAEEPHFGSAVATALLARDPDVEHLRARIGREISDRIAAALGPAGEPGIVESLQLLWAGALLYAGMGYAAYTEIADRVDISARLILGARC